MAVISASSCAFPSSNGFLRKLRRPQRSGSGFVRASANTDESDCNAEECAPDKEVGKVSMDWLAGEKTRVVGTFPPRKRGWTGYVEKDTAGQTNIYSVEPIVYVAESAISSGSAGTSSDGAENTVAVVAGLAIVSVVAASSVLIQVGKNSPQVQTSEYSGPSLSYYINKFKPPQIVEALVPPETQSPPTADEPGAAPALVESSNQVVALDPNVSSSS